MLQSVFDEHQCMPINFYLFSDVQCASLILNESLSYLIIILTIMSDIRLIKRMFSHNFGMENLLVQSVFVKHQCMFLNFHLFSVVQWVSLIFHTSWCYLIIIFATMNDNRTMKRSVFTWFWYGEFIGAICFCWASMYDS